SFEPRAQILSFKVRSVAHCWELLYLLTLLPYCRLYLMPPFGFHPVCAGVILVGPERPVAGSRDKRWVINPWDFWLVAVLHHIFWRRVVPGHQLPSDAGCGPQEELTPNYKVVRRDALIQRAAFKLVGRDRLKDRVVAETDYVHHEEVGVYRITLLTRNRGGDRPALDDLGLPSELGLGLIQPGPPHMRLEEGVRNCGDSLLAGFAEFSEGQCFTPSYRGCCAPGGPGVHMAVPGLIGLQMGPGEGSGWTKFFVATWTSQRVFRFTGRVSRTSENVLCGGQVVRIISDRVSRLTAVDSSVSTRVAFGPATTITTWSSSLQSSPSLTISPT